MCKSFPRNTTSIFVYCARKSSHCSIMFNDVLNVLPKLRFQERGQDLLDC